MFAKYFGWSLHDILLLTPTQISALQHGLSQVIKDENGEDPKVVANRKHDKIAELTEARAKKVNMPKGKIKLGELMKNLDLGYKG